MAVVATGSRRNRQNNYIIVVMCIVFGLWFGYDGWMNKEYQQKETDADGKPKANLIFNRYAPAGLAVLAAYFLVMAVQAGKRKVTADEKGITVEGKPMIPYSSMAKIDKRYFEKEGHFTLEYTAEGKVCKLKLTDRAYDNMGPLLDEVVRRTGAKPADSAS